jgi:hypothetical protein
MLSCCSSRSPCRRRAQPDVNRFFSSEGRDSESSRLGARSEYWKELAAVELRIGTLPVLDLSSLEHRDSESCHDAYYVGDSHD